MDLIEAKQVLNDNGYILTETLEYNKKLIYKPKGGYAKFGKYITELVQKKGKVLIADALLAGVFSGVPGISMVVSFLATKLLDFHILVVEFFGSMEQFLIRIEPYNPWVFIIYAVIFLPFLYKFFRWTIERKSGKIKICQDTVNGQQPKDKKRS